MSQAPLPPAATKDVRVYWSLSNHGGSGVAPELDPLEACRFLVRTAEDAGLTGVLVTAAPGSWDPWSIAAYLCAATSRVRFLVAHYSGAISPLILAQQTATLQVLSGDRLEINAVGGRSRVSAFGGKLREGALQAGAARDYWLAWRELVSGASSPERLTRMGIGNARLRNRLAGRGCPLIVAGASEPSLRLAAEVADASVFNASSYDSVRQHICTLRAASQALQQASSPAVGVRMHVLIRATEGEAHEAAAEIHRSLARAYPVPPACGASSLVVTEGLWSGVAELASGPGLTVVGTPLQVRAALRRFCELGVSFFILSGYDNRQELARFAADVRMPQAW